jgi:5'-deoxynucleotidase YfbR-like HD superfamily hydrolase
MSNRTATTIELHDGTPWDIAAPDWQLITPERIAVPLGRMCRWGGLLPVHYSVAQHSLLVAQLALSKAREYCNQREAIDLQLAALLHDAHEALWGFGDIVSPAKTLDPWLSGWLQQHADLHDRAVAQRFDLDPELFHHPIVEWADNAALEAERRDFKAARISSQVRKLEPFNGTKAAEYLASAITILEAQRSQ